MAASSVEICNLALVSLAEDTIASLDDPTERARMCKLLYDNVRSQLLRSYRWAFSVERAVLAPEADAPLFGFTYKFLKPVDCLRLIGPFDGNTSDSQINYTGTDITYKVEGRYILSDTNPLYICYIRDVTNPTDMDSVFTQALAYSLAKSLAMPLTNDDGKFKVVSAQYEEAIRSARMCSAVETTPEILVASDWLDSRYNGASGPRNSLAWF